MNAPPSAFAKWKERALFAAVAAALAVYAGTWALELAGGARGGSRPPAEGQTYVRASKPEPLPAGAAQIFAPAGPVKVWSEALRSIWVLPKKVVALKEIKPAKLVPPPATVPAPPMLLPVPGPSPEFTAGLPRWPAGPPAWAGQTPAPVSEGTPVKEAPIPHVARKGGIHPVEFKPRLYAIVILDTYDTLMGEILSARGASMVRVRTFDGRGVLAVSRKKVREIKWPLTVEQAHDKVALTIAAGDHLKWHGLALGCLMKRPPLLNRAVADLELATAAQPGHLASHLQLARVLLRLNRIVKARAAAERARSIGGGNAEFHIVWGKVLEASGDDPREEFKKALKLRPSVEVAVALARAERIRGDHTAAEVAVKVAESLAPGALEVLAARGDLLLARGDFAEAEVAYKSAVAAGSGGYLAQGDPGRAGVAAVMYLQGRLDEADKVLLAADVSDPQISYIQGLVRLVRGGEHLKEAKQRFLAAAQSGCARGYLGLGTYLYHDLGGDMAAALSEFRKAVAADRGDPHSARLAGWCQYRLGFLDGALGSYASVARIVPRHPVGHAAAGAVALARGSHTEAARLYREGLRTCPGSGRLLAGLGLAQIAAGDPDAASGSLAQALEKGFRGPDVYLGLGHVANARKDFDGSSRSFASGVASAQDAASPAAQAYARDALEKVHASRNLKLIAVFFDAAGAVQEPLRIHARFGPAPECEDGWLVFSGTQEKQDDGRTRVQTAIDGASIRSFAADVEVPAGSRATAGVFLESRNGGLEVARTRLGRAAFRMRDGRDAPWEDWRNLAAWPGGGPSGMSGPAGAREAGRMRLEIAVIETKQNLARVRLRVWKTLAGPEGVAGSAEVEFKQAFWRERALSAGLFVAARKGEEVRARFDNVFIVEAAE